MEVKLAAFATSRRTGLWTTVDTKQKDQSSRTLKEKKVKADFFLKLFVLDYLKQRVNVGIFLNTIRMKFLARTTFKKNKEACKKKQEGKNNDAAIRGAG